MAGSCSCSSTCAGDGDRKAEAGLVETERSKPTQPSGCSSPAGKRQAESESRRLVPSQFLATCENAGFRGFRHFRAVAGEAFACARLSLGSSRRIRRHQLRGTAHAAATANESRNSQMAPTFPKNAILKAMLLDLEGAEEAVWVSRFSFKL